MTPRERLRESLARNSEYIRRYWTREMREAISTALVFQCRPVVASVQELEQPAEKSTCPYCNRRLPGA